MKEFNRISPERINGAFGKVKWIPTESKSGNFTIWTDPSNDNTWTVVPNSIEDPSYKYYQDKNIKFLLYALDLPEDKPNYNEIISQLVSYNYKLINRIVSQNTGVNCDCVPYELANLMPLKNINAFRSFYQIKTGGKKKLPIESFKLNHTRHGSFIIPISILSGDSSELGIYPSETNTILHDYLEKIELLIKIDEKNEDKFINKMLDNEIDSILIKDFLSEEDSIGRYKEKYSGDIKELTISATTSPFIDYNLDKKYKEFKNIDLNNIKLVSSDLIQLIQEKEIEINPISLIEVGTKIRLIIDGINRKGTAKFRVVSVGNQIFDKPFYAETTELTQARINICADALKTSDPIEITGDIKKVKGKTAKIIVDTLGIGDKEEPLKLF